MTRAHQQKGSHSLGKYLIVSCMGVILNLIASEGLRAKFNDV